MSELVLQQVDLADVSSHSLLAFIKFMYIGTVEFIQADPVEVFLIADKYEVDKLAIAICESVFEKLSTENVVLIARALKNVSSRASCEHIWVDFCKLVQKSPQLFSIAMKAI